LQNDPKHSLLSPTSPTFKQGSDPHEGANGFFSIEAPDELVPLDNIYGDQYNINESNLFEVLEEQVAWWKDSTLERLLDRELVS
jgi:hypothetical protein